MKVLVICHRPTTAVSGFDLTFIVASEDESQCTGRFSVAGVLVARRGFTLVADGGASMTVGQASPLLGIDRPGCARSLFAIVRKAGAKSGSSPRRCCVGATPHPWPTS